jgi:hypothetical protein
MNPMMVQSGVDPARALASELHSAEDGDAERWPMPQTTIFVAVVSLSLWAGIGAAVYAVL